MGITPDRTPGPSEEEEIQLEDRTADGPPTINGAIRYYNGDVVVKLPAGVTSLTTGTGLSEGGHRALDQLVHEIAETCYQEVTRVSGKVESIIYWTDNGKTQKVRELLVARSGGLVTTMTIKQYDAAGSLVETLTGTITRSGGKVENIEWVLS